MFFIKIANYLTLSPTGTAKQRADELRKSGQDETIKVKASPSSLRALRI